MKLELKWVSIVFIAQIIWQIAERLLGIYGSRVSYHDLSGTAFMAVYALIMYLAVADLKAKNRGFLNRRQGFLSGLFISLILVALSPIMVAILMFAVQPDYFNVMIAATTEINEYSTYEAAYQEFNYWNYVKLYMTGYLLVGSLSAAFWSYRLHKLPDPIEE